MPKTNTFIFVLETKTLVSRTTSLLWFMTSHHCHCQCHHHQQTNNQSFLQAGWPSCRPTNSVKSLKGKILHSMDLLTPSSPGVFQLCLLPLIAPGYLGGGLPYLSSALWCQYPSLMPVPCLTLIPLILLPSCVHFPTVQSVLLYTGSSQSACSRSAQGLLPMYLVAHCQYPKDSPIFKTSVGFRSWSQSSAVSPQVTEAIRLPLLSARPTMISPQPMYLAANLLPSTISVQHQDWQHKNITSSVCASDWADTSTN